MEVENTNAANKRIEASIISAVIFSANTWMTLFAPLIIGVFASKLFAEQNFSLLEKTIYIVTTIVHLVFAAVIYMAGSRKSTTLAVDDLLTENRKYKTEIIPNAESLFETSKTQQSVVYLMTLELESIIDEMNAAPENLPFNDRLKFWEHSLTRILSHLVEHRSKLFIYQNDALYNFALYLHDRSSDELIVKWRSHDNRLKTSNRSWKPGQGHVGLAFIQGEAKICQDITKSSELSTTSTNPSDRKYRSFISVPINDSGQIGDGKKPLGVIVFTSDYPGQFSWGRDKVFTLTVAKLLSILIERNVAFCNAGYRKEELTA
ncbi:hypothetical protein [Pseudomonas sp. RIT411]|uniref:GAF domain-containing protein n=1 Tax=Pseudomonas sp. RIT411 TaxID=2202160 RepID=UPI0011BF4027|nr:hypothetical protein [Pseudomonas sp. RIT 411]